MATSTPTTAGLAWDSIDHYDAEGALESWDVLEAAAWATRETIRSEVEA